MYDIACIGILVADVICKTVDKIPERGKLGFVDSVKLYNGGGAMSAAINLKVLGAKSAILGKVGDDGLGAFLKGVLDSKQVDTRGLVVDPEVDTSAPLTIERDEEDGTWLVDGPWLQRLMANVNFDDYESRMWFDKALRESGLYQQLEERGIEDGDTVSLDGYEFEYQY